MVRATVLAMLLSLLVAAGCGRDSGRGDNQDRRTTEQDPETARYRRDGQALCRKLARSAPEAEPTGPVSSRSMAKELQTALAASDRFYRRLEALEVPDEFSHIERELLALEHRDDQSWRKVVDRLTRGMSLPEAIAPHEATIDRNRREANSLYEDLGLTACIV